MFQHDSRQAWENSHFIVQNPFFEKIDREFPQKGKTPTISQHWRTVSSRRKRTNNGSSLWNQTLRERRGGPSWRKFCMASRKRSTKLAGSEGRLGGEGAVRSSPGSRRVSPYTIPTAVAWRSGLKALRIPSRTTGRASSQDEPVLHVRAVLSCLCMRLTRPLAHGW